LDEHEPNASPTLGNEKTSGLVGSHQREKPNPLRNRFAASPSVRQRLVRVAYRFLWNRDDAEDAAQEALAVAIAKSGKLRDSEKWWPWLCKIVVRQCHLQGRRKLRRGRNDSWAMPASANVWAASIPAERAEVKALVRQLLGELPRRQHDVLVLRHFEEMPFEQIAEVLSISAATARVHAQQGRERLMELVLRHYPDGLG